MRALLGFGGGILLLTAFAVVPLWIVNRRQCQHVECSGQPMMAAVELPAAVTWRVTKWESTPDSRWKVAAVSDHPDGDWQAALLVAREWGRCLIDDIEAGQLRIKVDPVNMPGRGV